MWVTKIDMDVCWQWRVISGVVKGKGKGKAIPLQGWTDPEGSSKLRLPDFKTIGT